MLNKSEKYIPINKGHFELDTAERKKSFFNKLAEGWNDEYMEYRRLWTELPKNQIVRDYPLLVDLELASICNLKCPMCYTITEEFKKTVTKGFMDFNLIKRIIDEIAGKVYALRISLRGEPTLHPNYIEIIKYAKSKNIKEVSSLTNGSKIKGKYLRDVVDAGIDWLTISIDGMSDNYDKIRKPLTFKNILKQLKELKDYKKEIGSSKPVVKVQGVWPAIRPYPSDYYNTLQPLTDLIAYNPLIDYLSVDKDIVYEENFSCPQLYQRLVICSDGIAVMCANDEEGVSNVGDANKQTIHEIWHGDAIQKVRNIHKRNDGFKEINVCKKCYYPRKAIPDEKAVVNGREIYIENYINRAQEVGK